MSEAHLTLRSMKKVQGRQRLMWSMGTSGCAHAMAMACSTTTVLTLSTSSGRSQACIAKFSVTLRGIVLTSTNQMRAVMSLRRQCPNSHAPPLPSPHGAYGQKLSFFTGHSRMQQPYGWQGRCNIVCIASGCTFK